MTPSKFQLSVSSKYYHLLCLGMARITLKILLIQDLKNLSHQILEPLGGHVVAVTVPKIFENGVGVKS